jgi:hypothetical protein
MMRIVTLLCFITTIRGKRVKVVYKTGRKMNLAFNLYKFELSNGDKLHKSAYVSLVSYGHLSSRYLFHVNLIHRINVCRASERKTKRKRKNGAQIEGRRTNEKRYGST